MLIPNPKEDPNVVIVDHARIYSVLSNYQDASQPLYAEALEIVTRIKDARTRLVDLATAFSEDMPDTLDMDRLSGWTKSVTYALNSRFLRDEYYLSDDYMFYVEATGFRAKYKVAGKWPQPPELSTTLVIIHKDLPKDVGVAKMAVHPYPISRRAAAHIADMESGAMVTLWRSQIELFYGALKHMEQQHDVLVADLARFRASWPVPEPEPAVEPDPAPEPFHAVEIALVAPDDKGRVPRWLVIAACVAASIAIVSCGVRL